MRDTKGNAAKRVSTYDPAPWTKWRTKDRAERAIRFIETYLIIPKGYGTGKRMKLGQFQKDWLRKILVPECNSAVMSLPRGNGKSTLLAGLALWALFDPDPLSGAPQVPIVATTIGQAVKSVYGVAIQMVNAEPELARRSIRYTAIGATKLTVPSVNGEMFPISSDVDGLQGLDPSLAVCDEIGFQPLDSWNSLLLASGKRPNSLIVGIGTPGLDRDNALWYLRQVVMEGEQIPGFIYTEYAADHGTKVKDKDQWHRANPALNEGFMSLASLETAFRLAPEGRFRIFRLGQWVDGIESWLGDDGRAIWTNLTSPYALVEGAPTWIGVDVGIKRDSTAVATVQYRPDGKLHATCKIWVPQKEEPVDIIQVMDYIRKQAKKYTVGAISFDARFFDVPAKMLYDEGLPMVEIPQSVQRMTPIIGNLYEQIMTGGIHHDGDELFTTQVLNAVTKPNEIGFTLQKSKSRGRIDAAIALSLAVDRAQHKQKPLSPIVVL